MRARLRGVSAAEASAAGEAAALHLTRADFWRTARSVLVYAAVGGELDPAAVAEAAWSDGKRVFLPSPQPAELALRPRQWARGETLVPGPYGIPVPPTGALVDGDIDLVCVPGLAFDATGGRLGSGLGYYDRWLGAHPRAWSVGLGYRWQVVEHVPMSLHDVRMRALLTPLGLSLNLDTGEPVE
jgi:5-formyltetrahydrofolate cyclo-ligase